VRRKAILLKENDHVGNWKLLRHIQAIWTVNRLDMEEDEVMIQGSITSAGASIFVIANRMWILIGSNTGHAKGWHINAKNDRCPGSCCHCHSFWAVHSKFFPTSAIVQFQVFILCSLRMQAVSNDDVEFSALLSGNLKLSDVTTDRFP